MLPVNILLSKISIASAIGWTWFNELLMSCLLVGLGGIEPPTSPLSGVRSSHLSYRPGPRLYVAAGFHCHYQPAGTLASPFALLRPGLRNDKPGRLVIGFHGFAAALPLVELVGIEPATS